MLTPYVLVCLADCLYASGWIDLAAALSECSLVGISNGEVKVRPRNMRALSVLSDEVHRRMVALCFGARSCAVLEVVDHADARF